MKNDRLKVIDKQQLNMNKQILHISSGRGPAECMWVVARLLKVVLQSAKAAKLDAVVWNRVDGDFPHTLVSVSLMLSGDAAYDFAKEWEGSVLWTGQSPYRKFHKRKNWFVEIYAFDPPETDHFNEADIRYEYGKASGPGGQHANKNLTRVKAIHKPSGLSVNIQESRSQYQNKKLATQRLRKLLETAQANEDMLASEEAWKSKIKVQRGNPKHCFKGPQFKPVNK